MVLLLVTCLRSHFIATAQGSAGIVWKNEQLKDEKNIGDDASDDQGETELIEDRLHSQIRAVCDGESYHANVDPQQSGCHEQLGPSVIFNAAHMLRDCLMYSVHQFCSFVHTRSYAALRAADLDWIVGPGYSLGRVQILCFIQS